MVDSISRVPGATGGPPSQSPQPSDIRANLISMPEAIQRAPGSWLDASVINRSADGTYSLRTPVGVVAAQLPEGVALRLGSSMTLRVDAMGNLSLRILPTQFNTHLPVAQAPQPVPLVERPLLGGAVLVSDLPPVRGRVFMADQPQSEAARSVLGLLPQAGSGAFALAAALYPQILRLGELSRLLRQARGTGGIRNASSLLERIEQIAAAPAPRLDNSHGWLGWHLPFWDGRDIQSSTWLAKEEEADQDDPAEAHQALVQLELKNLGTVQLHCFASGEGWVFRFTTGKSLPEPLRLEIASILAFFAELFSISTSHEFQVGEEFFLPVTTL